MDGGRGVEEEDALGRDKIIETSFEEGGLGVERATVSKPAGFLGR